MGKASGCAFGHIFYKGWEAVFPVIRYNLDGVSKAACPGLGGDRASAVRTGDLLHCKSVYYR